MIAEIATHAQVLVIDDDPMVVERVRSAVPEWQITATHNGARGIERLRDAWDDIDLVLLDVYMPHGGVHTMAQIVTEAQARGRQPFRVVPFTICEDVIDLHALTALGASPALNKGMPVTELRLALHRAIGRPATPLTASGLAPYLARQALASEREVLAAEQQRLPVALLVRGILISSALREALVGAGCRVVAVSDRVDTLRSMLGGLRASLLVAEAGLFTVADEVAAACGLPVLFVAPQPSVAFRIAGTRHSVMLDVPRPSELGSIVSLVAGGQRYCDPVLNALLDRFELRDSERAVLQLLLAGQETEEIARPLAYTHQAVRRIRSRLLMILGLERTTQLGEWIDEVYSR